MATSRQREKPNAPGLFPDLSKYAKKYGEQNINVIGRLRILKDAYGFMPTSTGEINSAFILLDYVSRPGGAAKQLGEISIHQGKAQTTDANAAVRSVTNEYVAYARKARGDKFKLVALQEEIKSRDLVSGAHTLRSLDLIDGIGQLVRYHDLRQFAATGRLDVDPFIMREDGRRSPLDPYTCPEPTPLMKDHMQDVLGSVNVLHAHEMFEAMFSDQDRRKSFWADRLVEAQQHMSARPIAAAALQNLGFMPERV